MGRDLRSEIRQCLTEEGRGIDQYTKKAFQMLPALDRPRILDVGCGRGGPTMHLARLSGGQVIGIDIDRLSLETLATKIREAGLSDRVQAVRCSMLAMGFPDESFDVVWAEGSIFVVGFERGLKAWRRYIKPGGFLVVHEMVWLRPNPPPEIERYWKARYPGIRTTPENLERIPACGYAPIGHFSLAEDVWWRAYYEPLEARIHELRRKYAGDAEALAVLDQEQAEADLFKKHQKWYGSAFFVMQRTREIQKGTPGN
jgi:ubiquinone/menaquinone biosynthesis C-methylase UbiE